MAQQLEQMVMACSDVLTVGTRLATANDLPTAAVLHDRMAKLFDEMATRARSYEIAERDIVDARYALCAFLDEQVLKAVWSDRQAWLTDPLQLRYFGENTAGDGFYKRLDSLGADPTRRHVLEIYYLCLALGFRGRVGLKQTGNTEALLARLHGNLGDAAAPPDVLSVHGTLPGTPLSPHRYTSLLAIAGLILLAAGVAFTMLRSELQLERSLPLGEITSITRSVALRSELDTDFDGIPDSRDKCPYTAADLGTAELDDGCPPPTSGIAPHTAESAVPSEAKPPVRPSSDSTSSSN